MQESGVENTETNTNKSKQKKTLSGIRNRSLIQICLMLRNFLEKERKKKQHIGRTARAERTMDKNRQCRPNNNKVDKLSL